MAIIDKKFIHFKNYDDFISQAGVGSVANITTPTSGSEDARNAVYGQIKGNSIVFIKDTKQIWTHGQLYDGSSDTYTTEFTVSDLFSISEDSPLTINKEALVNAVLSDKLIIIPYQDNKGCYVVSVDAFDEEIYFNIHIFASVVSFVIYPNELTNEITVEDIFMTDFQEALISGENIRTINGEDIIGDGSDLELATKDELNAKADDASVVHTEGDETIRGTKTFYTGPKFLSSGDTNAIKFGTDTRINVDNLDGTTNTILGFIRQQFIVNSQRYPLYLNGQQERPKYNNFEDLALLSDVNNAVNDLNTRLNELGDQSIIPITWAELKDIRDNSLLKPGQQYRITDYVTTTTQENTQSAGHPFDVIVLALSENTLAEEAHACKREFNLEDYKDAYSGTWGAPMIYLGTYEHEGKVYHHYGTAAQSLQVLIDFDNLNISNNHDGIYRHAFIPSYSRYDDSSDWNNGEDDGESINFKTHPNYFANSNLAAWQIWYSLDNDAERFAWADAENGKGVIYRMIDEFGNDCPYDFKNIMMKNPNDSDDTNYYYTFGTGCYNNIILPHESNHKLLINKNIFGTGCRSNSFGTGCYSNSFGNYCINNIFGNDCHNNNLGNNCSTNSFSNTCYNNSFYGTCYNNSFGNYCKNNSFGIDCNYNSLGNGCIGNSFESECRSNSFGNSCNDNILGNGCDINSFGNYCRNNSLGDYCDYNSFGNNCHDNSFRSSASVTASLKDYCEYNHFDDGCCYIVIWTSNNTSSSNKLKNINVNRGVYGSVINIDTINSEQEINVNKVDGIVSIGEVLSIRYKSLKTLRDNAQLIPGRQYRIIDYNTTTSQENTTSAEHQFDIIVTALDDSTLSEEAQAIQNDNEGYFDDSNLSAWKIWYSLDNDTERFAWAGDEIIETTTVETIVADSSECYIKSELIDGNTFITPFNFESCVWVDVKGDNEAYEGHDNHDAAELVYEWDYFDNPKTGNTELCIYKSDAGLYEEEGCADSDDKYVYRGIVTVDGEEYDYWQKYEINHDDELHIISGSGYVFATTPRIVANPEAYSSETTTEIVETVIPLEPKGVIYYMKDEHDNEAPYDFKNIQFKRCKVTSDLEGADLTPLAQAYVGYSLSGYGASMPLHTLPADISDYKYVYTFSCVNNGSIVDASLGTSGIACYDNSMKPYIASNVQYLNDIVMYAHPESGNHCITKNTFASDCFSMTLGCEQVGEVWDNHFGQYCKNNIILGPYVYQNDFGANLTACYFSQQISQNQIGSYMQRNFVNNVFVQNVLGSSCKDNIFMKKCSLNTIGEQFMNNTCNDEFYQNNLGAGFLENTFNGKFYSNVSYNQFMRNTINGQCSCCDFGTQCTGNTLGIFRNSKVGSLFMSNVLCDTMACVFGFGFNCNNVTATKIQCNTFGTYVMYNNWTSSGNVKNIKVSDNLQGTTSNYNNIELPADSLCEVKVSRNSSGDIKIYCEADLIS
jgi:hypothetical protein